VEGEHKTERCQLPDPEREERVERQKGKKREKGRAEVGETRTVKGTAENTLNFIELRMRTPLR